MRRVTAARLVEEERFEVAVVEVRVRFRAIAFTKASSLRIKSASFPETRWEDKDAGISGLQLLAVAIVELGRRRSVDCRRTLERDENRPPLLETLGEIDD